MNDFHTRYDHFGLCIFLMKLILSVNIDICSLITLLDYAEILCDIFIPDIFILI